MKSSRNEELRSLGTLAWPLVLSYLGSQLLGIVDTAVVGRLGEVELGAVGLGNSLYFVFVAFGIGAVNGIDPLIAQAVGASERDTARDYFWQGLWLAGLISIPIMAAMVITDLVLGLSPLAPSTVRHTSAFLLARMPSVVPFLLTLSARSFLQAHDVTRPYLTSVVVANVLNFPLDWFLVFGDRGLVAVGLPAIGFDGIGVAGAGISTSLCVCVQAAIIFLAARALGVREARRKRLDPAVLRAALRLGVPVGLTIMAEVGVFGSATFLAGWLGPRPLAAHHIALTLASTTFQIPLAIGMAASVRVGQAVGAGDTARARRAGGMAVVLGIVVMGLCALVFLVAPRFVAGLLTNQGPVIEAARPLLYVAAAFQLFDGIQVVMAGSLRGAGDTTVPLVVNVLAHVVLGLPIAVLLAFGLHMGATGLWWGLCAGLVVAAGFLSWRFHRLSSKPIARLLVSRAPAPPQGQSAE